MDSDVASSRVLRSWSLTPQPHVSVAAPTTSLDHRCTLDGMSLTGARQRTSDDKERIMISRRLLGSALAIVMLSTALTFAQGTSTSAPKATTPAPKTATAPAQTPAAADLIDLNSAPKEKLM